MYSTKASSAIYLTCTCSTNVAFVYFIKELLKAHLVCSYPLFLDSKQTTYTCKAVMKGIRLRLATCNALHVSS